MNTKSTKLRTIELFSVLVTDIVVASVSYFLAHFLKYGSFRFDYKPEMYTTFLLIILLTTVVYTVLVEPGKDFTRRGYLVEFASVSKYVASIFVVMAGLLFMLKYAESYSRLMFGYFMVLVGVLTYLMRVLVKKTIRRYYRAEKNQTKLLVITDDNNRGSVSRMLDEKLDVMTTVSGWVIWDGAFDSECGNKDSYKDKVRLMTVDEVFVFLPVTLGTEIKGIIEYFEKMGVVVNYGIDVADMYAANGTVDNLAGFTVISYSVNEVNYNKRMIKRLADIFGGIVGSVITLALLPFIAIAIFIDNPGPVFFRQKRVGKNGRIFNIFKFRSMCRDAEQKKAELESGNEMEGLMFKLENDPRITRVGRFLRKTSLDEFPQFFNILAGDMSLVGTRPPTLDEYEQYDAHYKRRLSMKPGLTGMWQVSGRSDIKDFDEVVKLDLEYIDNWSMSLDIKILFKTIGAVLGHKGAR